MPQPSAALDGLWIAVGTHLWQTSLVLVALMLVARLSKRAPAGVVNALLLMGLVKLLVPLPLLKNLVGGALDSVFEAASTSPTVVSIASPVISGASALLDPAQSASPRLASGLQLGLTLAWVLGAAALATGWFFRSRATRAIPTRTLDDTTGAVRTRLSAALVGTTIPEASILVASEPVVPHVSGLVRPSIIMPAELALAVGTEELRGILLHEDAHRRRREPLRLLLARSAAIAFFFYPLLWPLIRRLKETGEMVCDEAALAAGAEPRAYARALAAVLNMRLNAAPSSAALDRNSPSLLRRRLERLNEPWRYKMHLRHRAVLLVAAVCLLLASAFAMTSVAGDPSTDAAAPTAPEKPVAPAAPAPDAEPEPAEEGAPLPDKFYIDQMVPPKYPDLARKAGVEAIVFLELSLAEDRSVETAELKTIIVGHPPLEIIKVGENGKVVEPVEEEGMQVYHEAFTQAAVDAALQWVIAVRPEDAEVENPALVVPIQFRLDGGEKTPEAAEK